MNNNIQQELDLGDYGINSEQACILCHLAGTSLMCAKEPNTTNTNCCLQPDKDRLGPLWEQWMHLVSEGEVCYQDRKYIPANLRVKYNLL